MIRLHIQIEALQGKPLDTYAVPRKVGEPTDEEIAYLTAIKNWLRSKATKEENREK